MMAEHQTYHHPVPSGSATCYATNGGLSVNISITERKTILRFYENWPKERTKDLYNILLKSATQA